MRRRELCIVSLFLVPTALAGCGPIGKEGAPRDQNAGAGGSPGTAGGSGSSGSGGADGGDDGDPSADSGGGGAAPPIAPGGYYVDGPTIRDAQGRPHVFHGLDRPSLEWMWSGD